MNGPGARTIGIVGLGLMGGSLARDLAERGWRVQGRDRDPDTEAAARGSGVVAGPIEPASLDLLVLAVPVRSIPGELRGLTDQLGADTVVTDLGSTKRSVLEAAETAGLGGRFVGSHPVAGDHRNGWSAARTGLFRDATVWICPATDATPGTVDRVEHVWREVGASPARIDPADHDRLLARTSHLPQAVATALAAVLGRAGVTPGQLGPGGRDMTRLAGSDPALWADILVDNHDHVARALSDVSAELARLERAVRGLDDATLRSLLTAGRAWSRDEQDPEAGVPGTRL